MANESIVCSESSLCTEEEITSILNSYAQVSLEEYVRTNKDALIDNQAGEKWQGLHIASFAFQLIDVRASLRRDFIALV